MTHRLAANKLLAFSGIWRKHMLIIWSASSRLLQKYPPDIEDTMAEELLHFAAFLGVKRSQHSPKDVSGDRQPELQLLLTIVDRARFPNEETIFKLFLCMMTTN